MNEIKQVAVLLLIVLPLFAGAFVFSYGNIRAEQREQARVYLIQNYHFASLEEREALMIDYGFTDDEINPDRLLNNFLQGE